jgi:hypothetical protein
MLKVRKRYDFSKLLFPNSETVIFFRIDNVRSLNSGTLLALKVSFLFNILDVNSILNLYSIYTDSIKIYFFIESV